jgi:transcription-repair coupling factor (superfamily II helicase)
LTPDDASAERTYNDLQFFYGLMGFPLDSLALFPEWETLPYEETAPHVGLIARRMTTLHRLLTGTSLILVTSVAAAMHRLIPRSTFEEAVLRFKTGGACEREPFLAGLLRLGYQAVHPRDGVQRNGIPRCYDLHHLVQSVFGVAGVDALWRVA